MAANRWRLVWLHAGLLLVAACTRSPDELMSDARAALASGQARTAEIHLKNLLQQQPDTLPIFDLPAAIILSSSIYMGQKTRPSRKPVRD